MNSSSHYDVVIIGAGMSGLAAGIRLAHFGKRVCIFERHNAVGGLNSFYSIAGRKYDVGLHALTNYAPPGARGMPLTRLLRQLRIEREALDLREQKESRIAFGSRGEICLRFNNDFGLLEAEVARLFPRERDGFRDLAARLRGYADAAPDAEAGLARPMLRRYVKDPLLEDMLLCPLMYYGSAREHDMDFRQFTTLFNSIFLEGLCRPVEGVRRVLRVLLTRYRESGGERRMKCGVARLNVRDGRVESLTLDSGEEITADQVLSSIGRAETEDLRRPPPAETPRTEAGRLSFVETMSVFRDAPAAFGWGDDTIVFYNDSSTFDYARPDDEVDVRSGVVCLPNNFDYDPGEGPPEGLLRVTCIANYDRWVSLEPDAYGAAKARWFDAIQESARRFLPPVDGPTLAAATVATDMFTPRTIEKYTGHRQGAIYGAAEKSRSGRTDLSNLFLCGTDQGLLGVMGSLLSGITMANLHLLRQQG